VITESRPVKMLVQPLLQEQNQVQSRAFINYWQTIQPVSVTSLPSLRTAGTQIVTQSDSAWCRVYERTQTQSTQA